MSDDVLAGFSTDRVAAWYRRLANFTIARAAELQPSLAGAFLLKWLDNRASTATYNFVAPDHLKRATAVYEVQRYHRDVFLTNQKARVKSGETWGGILPRPR
jgi:hypothetical protein